MAYFVSIVTQNLNAINQSVPLCQQFDACTKQL